jgi:hypothetical protein
MPMLSMRGSTAAGPNRGLTELAPKADESNAAWLGRAGATEGILLLGGAGVADFRLRYAQSALRDDLTPSHWSLAGILLDAETFLSVPLDVPRDAATVPPANGVRRCAVADYEDAQRYPNIAVLSFSGGGEAIRNAAVEVSRQRGILDLPALVVAWLAYVWGVEDDNPLVEARGIPSAAFVEAAYSIANIELTPGLASASSCPEAIWQSAKWWGDYYRESARVSAAAVPRSPDHAEPRVPGGQYAIRQPAAAATVAPAVEPLVTSSAKGKKRG